MNSSIRRTVTLVLVALAAGAANAGETPAEKSRAIVLPPPKVELPPLPADGSGIWRLHLEDYVSPLTAHGGGVSPLWVVLEVDKGRIVRAAAAPMHQKQGDNNWDGIGAWGHVDTGKLTITRERVAGSVSVSLYPMWRNTVHLKMRGGAPNREFSPYELKPATPETIEIDVTLDGHRGAGSWRRTQTAESKSREKSPDKGAVVLWREPVLPTPPSYDLEFLMPGVFGNLGLKTRSVGRLRARMSGKAIIAARGWMGDDFEVAEIAWSKTELADAEGRVKGRFEAALPGRADARVTLDVEGQRIGRNLFGLVTLRQGDHVLTTPWRGLMDCVSCALPVMDKDLSSQGPVWRGPAWSWQHDLKHDPQLAAAALEESAIAVLPNEPGKTDFWTWRRLVNAHYPNSMSVNMGSVSVICPPCFDLEETPGAAKYRFGIKSKGNPDKTFSFEADKPWRPLAPIWKDLPPGNYTLTVKALDGTNKELPGPMRMGMGINVLVGGWKSPEIDPYRPGRKVVETGPIPFVKRPCFAGPYSTRPARSWTEAALAIATWAHSEGRGHQGMMGAGALSRRGLTPGQWEDFNCYDFSSWMQVLTLRALTEDAGQRLQAEQMLRFACESQRLHQRGYGGLFSMYGGFTPLAHWGGEHLLDAWLETGDPAWKERCLEFGRGLGKVHNANGTFLGIGCYHGEAKQCPQTPLPEPGKLGYWSYGLSPHRLKAQFGTADLLYTLGRLRRDLKTDEFLETERLAYHWVMEVAVRERYFPLFVPHSLSINWPQVQHSVSALYISRYLLECAPPQWRDVKLAEELARWAEDYRVDWSRADEGPQQGGVKPRIDALDRGTNAPLGINLLAAIVFERLGQETGNRLWTAKGEALATAVLVAMHPENGYINDDLDTANRSAVGFALNWAPQLLREYAALKAAKK